MSFFKRLFGFFSDEKTQPAAPAARVAAPTPAPTPVKPVDPASLIFIGWGEMIDGQAKISGYLLRPRSLATDRPIAASALRQALEREQVARFAEQRLVIIPLTANDWQTVDFRSLIKRRSCLMIEDLARLESTERSALLDTIRAAGARLAVDLRNEADLKLADMADIVLFDFQTASLATLEKTAKALRQRKPGLLMAADNVHTWAEHRLCLSLGFDFCLGSFAATRDAEASAGPISESRLVVIEMLNQLRSDVELAELATTAMRDPAVVVKLLDMANSPLYGLPRKVANLEEAIMLLGRDAVYRWLAIALLHVDANSGRDQTLMVFALCRAAFLKQVAGDADKQKADEMFLVGLLSILESLLGLPMSQILEKMRLPETVADALLRGEGPYARPLQLALALERCRLDQAIVLATSIRISPTELLDYYREAMTWATAEVGNS